MKCDLCANEAAYHLTEVEGGKPVSRHLCLGCGKDEVPCIPEMVGMAAAKLLPEMLRCQRCKAATSVIVFKGEVGGVDKSMKRMRSRLVLCAACAAVEGLKYKAVPGDQVAVVVER